MMYYMKPITDLVMNQEDSILTCKSWWANGEVEKDCENQ